MRNPPAQNSLTPFWALATITWINSLGSGLLWSGVPFITEHRYGFEPWQNLLLALVESVIYVGVAFAAGPLLRAMHRRNLSTRAWLALIFLVELAGGLLVLCGLWGLLVSACLLSAVGAALWPLMESYLSAGRHGHDMRRAIGHFNVAWMSATAASLLLMAPLMKGPNSDMAMVVMVPVALSSLFFLRWFPKHPAPHSDEAHRTHVPANYRSLLLAARFILPVSYIFISVQGALMPFRMNEIGVAPEYATAFASLWMFARLGTTALLAYAPFWHGRWGALGLGALLLTGGFVCIMLATTPLAMAAGLLAFGTGHGILYYAALYYAMAVGAAGVGAAGVFEALIGVGYVIGPSIGLLCQDHAGAQVLAVCAMAMVGMAPAAWIWLKSRPRTAAR